MGLKDLKEPRTFISVGVALESHNKLIEIAQKQGFTTKQGYPSRARAIEYLIRNFEAPIA